MIPGESFPGGSWEAVIDGWAAVNGTFGSPMTLASRWFWFTPQESGFLQVDVDLGYQLLLDREYYLYAVVTEDDADAAAASALARAYLSCELDERQIDAVEQIAQDGFAGPHHAHLLAGWQRRTKFASS